MSLAYHSVGDFTEPSDGFCDKCPCDSVRGWHYQNSGKNFDYVRQAIMEKLKRDGFEIDAGFDPETGREIDK